MAAATRRRGGGVKCWHVAAVDTKGGGGGKDGGGNRCPSVLFFCRHFGLFFYLAYVELYGRISNKGNIAIFPLS